MAGGNRRNSGRISKRTWDLVHEDYMLGKYTIDELAGKYGINRHTLNTRIRDNKWSAKRREEKEKHQKSLYEQFIEKITEITSKNLEVSKMVVHIALEALVEIYQDSKKETISRCGHCNQPNIKHKPLRNSISEVNKIARMAESASRIMKNIIPEGDEEVTEMLIQELKKLNDVRNKENEDNIRKLEAM